MSKSLAKNTLFTLVANVSLAASNWLVLVIIAKQFSSEMLGIFVLALSFCSPAFLFASFKIRTLLVVDSLWRFKLEEYASARLLANLLVTLLLLLAVWLKWVQLPWEIIALVILYKWSDSWSEFCQSYLRRLEQFSFASGSLCLRSVASFAAVLAIGLFSDSFMLLVIVWCAMALIFALLDSYVMVKQSAIHEVSVFNFGLIIKWQSISQALLIYKQYFTVALALAISSLFVYLPNLLLSYQLNLEAAGQFAAISYFLIAGGILVNSISQACTPKLAFLLSTNNYLAFSQLVKKMCGIGVLIGFCGFMVAYYFGFFFLTMFYTTEIAEQFIVLNWVMAAAAVRYIYIFLGTSLAAVQHFHIQTKIYAVGLLTMCVAGYLLINMHGLAGAGQAMLLATLVELSCFVALSKSHWQMAFQAKVAV